MTAPILAAGILALMLVVFARLKQGRTVPLSWPATLAVVPTILTTLWATNEFARRCGNCIFVVGRYGITEARRAHLRIVWDSRSSILISNGDHLGTGASQVLQLITMVIWMASLIAAFFLLKWCSAKCLPTLYMECADFCRQLLQHKAPHE